MLPLDSIRTTIESAIRPTFRKFFDMSLLENRYVAGYVLSIYGYGMQPGKLGCLAVLPAYHTDIPATVGILIRISAVHFQIMLGVSIGRLMHVLGLLKGARFT